MEQGFIRTSEYDALEKAVVSYGGDPSVLSSIWSEICTGNLDGMEILQTIIGRTGMSFQDVSEDDLSDVNRAMGLMMEFANSRRKYKGWPPNALSRKMHPRGRISMSAIMPDRVHAGSMMKEAE